MPWTFFANGLGQSANSLVGNANLIKKIYFPRLAVPIATILSGVIDFALAFPGRPIVCTLHHHKQIWWTSSDRQLLSSLRELVP